MLRRLIILTALAICVTGGLRADELQIYYGSGVDLNAAMVYVFPRTSTIEFEGGSFFLKNGKPHSETFPMISAKGTRHLLVTTGNLLSENFKKKADVKAGRDLLVPIGRTAGFGSKKTGVDIINNKGQLDYRYNDFVI